MTGCAEPQSVRSRSPEAYFEASFELLRAMADVLDIRTLLPRLSGIVKPLLPHDALADGVPR